MFIIKCPYCGERDQTEFSNGGEAHVARPINPDQVSDREWSEYVFVRANPKGIYYERWVHTHGCKKWFNAVRDTSTDEILKVYKLGEAPPSIKNFKNHAIIDHDEGSVLIKNISTTDLEAVIRIFS